MELTSSSLNRPYGPPRDTPSLERISELYHRENFGLIGIDWQAGTIRLVLKGREGQDTAALSIAFADLGLAL